MAVEHAEGGALALTHSPPPPPLQAPPPRFAASLRE
jgi:hypothetical protein